MATPSVSRSRPQRPTGGSAGFWAGESGLAVNSVAGALFGGLVAFVLVFPLIARAELPGYLSRWAMIVAGVLCVIFMLGIYLFLSDLKRRRFAQGAESSIYFHELVEQHLGQICPELEKRLEAAERDPLPLFRDMLRDKLCHIVTGSCRSMVDIVKMVEESGLCACRSERLERFFTTRAEYAVEPLPDAIQQVQDMVAGGQTRFGPHLKRLKAAHRRLFCVMGDYLDVLPPIPRAVHRLQMTYPYLPLESEASRRILFALTVLHHLNAEAKGTLGEADRRRLEELARKRVPRLREALNAYRTAWHRLAADYRSLNRPEGAAESDA